MTEAERAQAEIAHAGRSILAGGNHVVLGVPGTGKSSLARRLTAELGARHGEDQVLLLAPTRRAATRLRDDLAREMNRTVGTVLVRTPASLAFSVLRSRSALLGEALPSLMTGADQDAALAEILAGHAEGEGRDPRWPGSVPTEALGLASFRHELRDLLMRSAEAGWDGYDLIAQGERHGRPEWVSAGRVLTEYDEITRLGEATPDRGTRFDVASILDEAAGALRAWEQELPQHPRPTWHTVIHDDYQDASLATARLLSVLADHGSRIVVLGDPDVAVQTFRGAVPALLARASTGVADAVEPGGAAGAIGAPRRREPGEFAATAHVLSGVWRGDSLLREVAERVSAVIPALAGGQRRRAHAVRPQAGSSLEVMLLRSVPEEARAIARRLRTHRLRDGIEWSQMVVLVRASGQLQALRRGLRAGGVPVATAQGEVPLRDEPAVRPLLRALALAAAQVSAGVGESDPMVQGDGLAPEAPDGTPRPEAPDLVTQDGAPPSDEPSLLAQGFDPQDVVDLLLSPLGGLDAVGLRSLRRTLRGAELAAGGARSSDELLLESVIDHAHTVDLPARLRGPVRRVARVLASTREALRAPEASIETVLWAAWDASGLSRVWRERALGSGATAERADADLDAVLALFRAADQFAQRQQGAAIAGFAAYLEAQEFAPDTLAAHGARSGSVQVMTAASAAGLEWDVVVVAGLQEDVWPDLRLRAQLLGSDEVTEAAAGRAETRQRPLDARRAVLADEVRILLAALTRSRQHLLLTAAQDTETRASVFLDLVDPPDPDVEAERPVALVPPALDLRGLTATLRRAVLAGTGHRSRAAGELLSVLIAAGVPGADPALWWGMLGSSSQSDLFAPEDLVRVTPSSLTTLAQCPLRWSLTSAGGQSSSRASAELGILIHGIAADLPRGTHQEMLEALEIRWPSLGLGNGWPARAAHDKAVAMVKLLADYVATIPGEVETEVPFDVTLGRAHLVGRVDRVEHVDIGLDRDAVRIVDLKTSATKVSALEAETHPQLGAYQAAVLGGGFGDVASAGARLIYADGKSKTPALRDQVSIEWAGDEQPWTQEMLDNAVDTMASASFAATPGPYCGGCPVASSCPARAEGARVVSA